MAEIVYGGIDPSGSAERPSGCAAISAKGVLLGQGQHFRDEEIIRFFEPYTPVGVAIDAPCALPLDMSICCLEDPVRCRCEVKQSRACERQLTRMGYSLYPVNKNTFPDAKRWIRRGLLLYLRFQSLGISTFEVYPNASMKILYPRTVFPRPKTGIAARKTLQDSLSTLIAQVPPSTETTLSDHALDAILAAYTLYLYREKKLGELIGDAREGRILIPTGNPNLREGDFVQPA